MQAHEEAQVIFALLVGFGRYSAVVWVSGQPLVQAVIRYVERNALRANLCQNAEDWFYGSLWRRVYGEGFMETMTRGQSLAPGRYLCPELG